MWHNLDHCKSIKKNNNAITMEKDKTGAFCITLSCIQQLPVLKHLNPFSAGTAFMLMQTGWIHASRRLV